MGHGAAAFCWGPVSPEVLSPREGPCCVVGLHLPKGHEGPDFVDFGGLAMVRGAKLQSIRPVFDVFGKLEVISQGE